VIACGSSTVRSWPAYFQISRRECDRMEIALLASVEAEALAAEPRLVRSNTVARPTSAAI
jgi:hypothetical protein